MFPIILIMSLFCQGQTTDYGTEFVTAFPENLAYYYPATLTLTLKITTLIPSTNINVFLNGLNIKSFTSGNQQQVYYVTVPNAEVNQIGPSGNVVKITSNNNITVYSVSTRGDSIQTSVVLPTRNLGMQYLVPSFNYTDLAVRLNTYNVSQFIDTTTVPMDFSFRLIIINAEAVNNTVTVTQTAAGGNTDTVITLGPYSLNQLPSDDSYFQVSSTGKVAVILTNPCIDTPNCKCNMVAHQLRPISLLGNSFLYPYYNATVMGLFVASENNVDITSGSQKSTVSSGSIAMLPYFPGLSTGSTILTTSQSASVNVIYPGLIVELLPTTRFAGCYLVHSTANNFNSMALIIAQTGATGGVKMGAGPLTNPTWNALNDTGYSYALVSISSQLSNFIWHPSSPIGVYIIETSTTGVNFGGPAIVLNDEPDPNGCVVVPIPFVLSNNTMSWQASRAFCKSNNMVLASPNLEFTQNKMVQSLINMNAAGDVWLGMRRNLTTSNWYWNNDNDITFTNWDDNEPSSGMCVSLTVDHSANFKWSTERCCTPMQPLCEGIMVLMTSITDTGS